MIYIFYRQDYVSLWSIYSLKLGVAKEYAFYVIFHLVTFYKNVIFAKMQVVRGNTATVYF